MTAAVAAWKNCSGRPFARCRSRPWRRRTSTAQTLPNVFFENATGTSTLPNLSIYNARFYEGRYVQGVIAARKSRTKQIGYIASFPVPEVIHAINTVMRGAWSVDPSMKVRVVWVGAWFNPGREAEAARALVDQGCDVLCQHTDSPAPLQVAEERRVFGFGQASDMTRFAPKAHLTSSINNWGDYYASRARAVIDGTWRPGDVWGGLKSGMCRRHAAPLRRPHRAPGRHHRHPGRPAPDRRADPLDELLLPRHRGDDAELIGSTEVD